MKTLAIILLFMMVMCMQIGGCIRFEQRHHRSKQIKSFIKRLSELEALHPKHLPEKMQQLCGDYRVAGSYKDAFYTNWKTHIPYPEYAAKARIYIPIAVLLNLAIVTTFFLVPHQYQHFIVIYYVMSVVFFIAGMLGPDVGSDTTEIKVTNRYRVLYHRYKNYKRDFGKNNAYTYMLM